MSELYSEGTVKALLVAPAMLGMYVKQFIAVTVTNNTLTYLDKINDFDKIFVVDIADTYTDFSMFPETVVGEDKVVRLNLPRAWNMFQLVSKIENKITEILDVEGDGEYDLWY